MAPVAPSPHRFLHAPKRAASPSKAQPPASLGSKKYTVASDGSSAVQQQPSSSQFAPAPRFSFGQQNAQKAVRAQSPPKSSLPDALFASIPRIEEVETVPSPPDSGLLHNDAEMLDKDEISSAIATTEVSEGSHASCIHFPPKRRKVEDKEVHLLPLKSTSEAHTVVTQHSPEPARRFVKHRKFQSTIEEVNRDSNRPAFRKSSIAPQESSIVPAPEAFSPHRRGHRFVPGGLATTAQQWVIEVGRTAIEAREHHPYLRGEEFAAHGKVEQAEVEEKGPCLVKARTENGGLLNIMLPPASRNSFDELQAIKAGNSIAIKAPTWDLELQGATWTVGIEWKLL